MDCTVTALGLPRAWALGACLYKAKTWLHAKPATPKNEHTHIALAVSFIIGVRLATKKQRIKDYHISTSEALLKSCSSGYSQKVMLLLAENATSMSHNIGIGPLLNSKGKQDSTNSQLSESSSPSSDKESTA